MSLGTAVKNIKKIAGQLCMLCVSEPALIGLLLSTLPAQEFLESAASKITRGVKFEKIEHPIGRIPNGAAQLASKELAKEAPPGEALPAYKTVKEGVTKRMNLPFTRIAVLSFESGNEYLAGDTLSDYFVYHLLREFPDVTIVERQELQKIIKEQNLSLTGAINAETVISIGKILGVDAIFIGKIRTLDTILSDKGTVVVVYRIVDTNTGEVVWSDRQTAKIKPKLIQWFESDYKNPMEVADNLMEKVAHQSIVQLRFHFSRGTQGKPLTYKR